METRTYRFRITCLSCGNPVSGIAVIVLTPLPEDEGHERAFVVHEDYQNALIKDLPYWDSLHHSAVTRRPRF